MRKRLSLARVLLQQAELVLLDEPYGELDPPGFALVDGVIGELRATRRHGDHGDAPRRPRARRCATGRSLLEEGRLAWSGPAREMPAEAPGGSAPA